jgi:hypothetical protein
MFVEEKQATAPVVVDAIGDILLKAADLIERDGWCQNSYWGPNGEHCALGAIQCSVSGCVSECLDHNYFVIRAKNRFKEFVGIDHIQNWNDASGRTKEDVVTAMRGAAFVQWAVRIAYWKARPDAA